MTRTRLFFVGLLVLACAFVGLLLSGDKLSAQHRKDTALLDAVKAGSVPSAERALAEGANIEVRNHEDFEAGNWREDEFTPLALAIARDNLPMARMLLAHGANVRAKTKESGGFPPRDIILSTAVQTGQLEMVRLLLDSGAAVDGGAGMDVTPLMLAARDYQPEIVKLLLQRGANVNARDERGFTPLRFTSDKLSFTPRARRTDHSAVIRMLKKAGATM